MKRNSSGYKMSYVIYLNHWQYLLAHQTDLSSLMKIQLKIVYAKFLLKTKIKFLYVKFHVLFNFIFAVKIELNLIACNFNNLIIYIQKIQSLKEKVGAASDSANRQSELVETSMIKMRNLEEDRAAFEAKVHKLESELTSCELTKESLRRDKQNVSE